MYLFTNKECIVYYRGSD